jgi:hypothetical protein
MELSVLIVDNYIPLAVGGATRPSHPHVVDIELPTGKQSLRIIGSFVGHRAGLITICHELCHVLGSGVDLYGATNNLNTYCTLMGATAGTPDDQATYHLDPWHKMQFGWSEPRIFTLDSIGAEIVLPAANMGNPEAPVILYDPKHGTNEYFMLEYRSALNAEGSIYDKNVHSNGLAIWHVFTPRNHSPIELPSLTETKQRAQQILAGSDTSIFLDGASDLARGGNTPWASGQVTPPLGWLDESVTGTRTKDSSNPIDAGINVDGSSTGTRIKVRPFNATDASITVELMLNVLDEFNGPRDVVIHVDPVVETKGKFDGLRDRTP